MNVNLEQLAKSALSEDMPNGDITTNALNLEDQKGLAKLIAKEDLVLSGIEIFTTVFAQLDSNMQFEWFFKSGDFIFKNQTVCLIKGEFAALLKAERTALNFLGRLSGIASLTRCYVAQTEGTKTKILDTRKTTPGLRALEKKAVRDGGGHNHRMNLSDAILIKENHIQAAGGITQAIELVRKHRPTEIEIEIRNLKEAQEALALRADRLLLDNMTNEDMAEVLKMTPATIQTEASGNMTLERVKSVAEIGVDYISVGALTHSAPCADLSLLIELVEKNAKQKK